MGATQAMTVLVRALGKRQNQSQKKWETILSCLSQKKEMTHLLLFSEK
mgnify:CR=1 FL=1